MRGSLFRRRPYKGPDLAEMSAFQGMTLTGAVSLVSPGAGNLRMERARTVLQGRVGAVRLPISW